MISYGIDAQGFRERQFAQFIVPSDVTKRALEASSACRMLSSFRISRSASQRRASSASASAVGLPKVTASILPNAIRAAFGMARPP
jgi:hypothetical protein